MQRLSESTIQGRLIPIKYGEIFACVLFSTLANHCSRPCIWAKKEVIVTLLLFYDDDPRCTLATQANSSGSSPIFIYREKCSSFNQFSFRFRASVVYELFLAAPIYTHSENAFLSSRRRLAAKCVYIYISVHYGLTNLTTCKRCQN